MARFRDPSLERILYLLETLSPSQRHAPALVQSQWKHGRASTVRACPPFLWIHRRTLEANAISLRRPQTSEVILDPASADTFVCRPQVTTLSGSRATTTASCGS